MHSLFISNYFAEGDVRTWRLQQQQQQQGTCWRRSVKTHHSAVLQPCRCRSGQVESVRAVFTRGQSVFFVGIQSQCVASALTCRWRVGWRVSELSAESTPLTVNFEANDNGRGFWSNGIVIEVHKQVGRRKGGNIVSDGSILRDSANMVEEATGKKFVFKKRKWKTASVSGKYTGSLCWRIGYSRYVVDHFIASHQSERWQQQPVYG